MQRTGRQGPLAWPKKEVTLGVWPCRKATGVPGLGGGWAVTGLRWPAWCPNLPLHPAVELLADIVQNCSLEDSQIEKGRDVILRELQENDASMRDVVFDYLHATAFQGTPLAQAVEGPSENIR